MKKNIFISYIVPCYNIQEYLPRCLDSLSKQYIDSNEEVEFVLVNDGSPDNCLEIIREFAAKDHRAVVIDQKNQGVSIARNNGLNVAKGKYVFFLDGDDWLIDDASEKIYRAGSKGFPDILIMGNYKAYEGEPEAKTVWVDASKCATPGTYKKNDLIVKAKSLPISFKIYRTEFLKQRNIAFDSSLIVGELYAFFIMALAEADKVGVSGEYVMYYLRRKEGSAVSQLNCERDLRILDTLHLIDDIVATKCPKIGKISGYRKSLFWLVLAFSVLKYAKRVDFQPEIGILMDRVKKDSIFRKLMKSIISDSFSISNKHCVLSLLLLYLPSSVCYSILRGGIKIYMYLH